MQKLLKASTMERIWPDSSCFPTLIQLERDTGRKTIVETNKATDEILLSHLRWVGDNQNDGGSSHKGCESDCPALEVTNANTSDSIIDQTIFRDRRGQRLEIIQYILKTIDKEVQNLLL